MNPLLLQSETFGAASQLMGLTFKGIHHRDQCTGLSETRRESSDKHGITSTKDLNPLPEGEKDRENKQNWVRKGKDNNHRVVVLSQTSTISLCVILYR